MRAHHKVALPVAAVGAASPHESHGDQPLDEARHVDDPGGQPISLRVPDSPLSRFPLIESFI